MPSGTAPIGGGVMVDFAAIYTQYQAAIYRHICRMVSDREQAEDLTQDTFVKAMRGLPYIGPESNISAWLRRIATNTTIDRLRRLQRYPMMPFDALDYEPVAPDAADPQETFGTVDLVRSALAQIPPRARLALLAQQDGMSPDEIAATLGMPSADAAKMYLHRARQQFRACYRLLAGDDAPVGHVRACPQLNAGRVRAATQKGTEQ